MIKQHQVTLRAGYALTLKQFVTFLLGLTCALPAVSLADELDDVINDLLAYRASKRQSELEVPFSASQARDVTTKATPKGENKPSKNGAQRTLRDDDSSQLSATKK